MATEQSDQITLSGKCIGLDVEVTDVNINQLFTLPMKLAYHVEFVALELRVASTSLMLKAAAGDTFSDVKRRPVRAAQRIYIVPAPSLNTGSHFVLFQQT